MSWTNDITYFEFGADADLNAAGDVGTFYAYQNIQVLEVGCFITTDLVPGGASVEVAEFDITSASVGIVGSEATAPTRAASSVSLTTSSTNATHQDGKILAEQCDFTVAKGETLTCQGLANVTSGAARFYMLYRPTGQSLSDAGVQRGAVAAE